MRQTIITSIISAVVGGIIVLVGVLTLMPPQESITREILKPVPGKRSTQAGEISAEQIYDKFSPAVVNVSVRRQARTFFGLRDAPEEASGSGFIISKDGLIVTNAHVVEGAKSVIVTLSDKSELIAKVLGTDPSADLAVLQIDPPSGSKIIPIELGSSTDVRVGDTVYAIGNPLGLDRSMSRGIISALDRTIDAPNGFQIRKILQTDTAINRGNSGGPLINIFGEVIGVTAQIATESGSAGNIGIAFAIPGNTVKDIVKRIKSGEKISHAWLGIAGRDVTKSLASELKLPVNSGALVSEVFPDSPAKKANLIGGGNNPEKGDVIVEFGGKKIGSMEELVATLEEHKVGEDVPIIYYRGGKREETKVTLTDRPQSIPGSGEN